MGVGPKTSDSETELVELMASFSTTLNRVFLFFQGLSAGLLAFYCLILYMFSNSQSAEAYEQVSNVALRLNQMLHIVVLISLVGGSYKFYAIRSSKQLKVLGAKSSSEVSALIVWLCII